MRSLLGVIMSRPSKKGLEYFPLDVDFFADDKIDVLLYQHGPLGVLFYIEMLCRTYRVGACYKWDDRFFGFLQRKLGGNEEEIRGIMKTCLEVGLFDKEVFENTGFLTSKGIQKRFFDVLSMARRVEQDLPDGVLLLKKRSKEKEIQRESKVKESSRVSSEETRVNSEETRRNKIQAITVAEVEKSDLTTNTDHVDFDDFATEIERYIEGLGVTLSEPEKIELRGIFGALQEINSQELAETNLWVIEHKRPMKKYPHIWLTIQQLHQIWKSYIQAGLRPGIDFPKIFLEVESKLAKKARWELERVDAFSWLIGWALKQATDQLTSEQRLVNTKEASLRYGSAMR
jgi:hypothetical protein